MQITAENLDRTLYEGGYLITVRRGDDGHLHVGRVRAEEDIDWYDFSTVFHSAGSALFDVQMSIDKGDAATIHYSPHDHTYTVRVGESVL